MMSSSVLPASKGVTWAIPGTVSQDECLAAGAARAFGSSDGGCHEPRKHRSLRPYCGWVCARFARVLRAAHGVGARRARPDRDGGYRILSPLSRRGDLDVSAQAHLRGAASALRRRTCAALAASLLLVSGEARADDV